MKRHRAVGVGRRDGRGPAADDDPTGETRSAGRRGAEFDSSRGTRVKRTGTRVERAEGFPDVAGAGDDERRVTIAGDDDAFRFAAANRVSGLFAAGSVDDARLKNPPKGTRV